jgi:hypothetical protein
MMKKNQLILHIKNNMVVKKEMNRLANGRIFVCLKISKIYKIRNKKWAPNMPVHLHRNFRRTLNVFGGVTVGHCVRQRALAILKHFITGNLDMTLKVRAAFKNLIFMQKKIKCRNVTREAKIDILENYWNKLLGQIHRKNQEVGDKKTQTLLRAISGVKANIRRKALHEYLRCAQTVHTIAFLQWRMLFPSSLEYHEEMLRELL